MTETTITLNKKDGTSGLAEVKSLITIQGTLTSSIQLRGEGTPEPYHYAFIRLKGQSIDLPVIFKLKDSIKSKFYDFLDPHYIGTYEMEINQCPFCQQTLEAKYYRKWCWNKECLKELELFEKSNSWIKPNLKKSDEVELNGNYSNSPQNVRKSFTATSYQFLNHKNKCLECGDGNGTIKFPNQPSRPCKTCYLTKKALLDQAKSQLPKLEAEAEKISQIRQRLERDD